MRLRNVKNAQDILDTCSFLITSPEKYQGHYQDVFQNKKPICLEIGMGKGSFLIKMAKKNPQINYIGIEKMTSILARAIQNITPYNLPNLKVMRLDALNLNEVFQKEIDTIYLNFSDPWPKTRHAKRRLTSENFLQVYDSVFKGEKKIIQKTDNPLLFESSIISLSNYGYKIKEISLDLHQTDIENEMTEYETKFSQMGVKINYLKATKK